MTPTPPSTNASSSGHSPDNQHFRVVRKRNRVPLSCAPCRHRKLKCNRGHPCDNCSKRGDIDSCTYAAPGVRKKNQSSHGSANSPDEMQNRIDRLEGLVLSLMTNGAQSAGPAAAAAAIAASGVSGSISESSGTDAALDIDDDDMLKDDGGGEDSDVETVVKSLGVMKVDNNKQIFASEAHWYAILGEITEVKNYFADHKKQYEDQNKKIKALQPEHDKDSPGTALLFRTQRPSSKAEILSSFPTKHTADLLITRYFNIYDPAVHIIHGPKYQREYDLHWLNPEETPVIWLGLTFAMMTLALQSYTRAGDEPPEYRNRTWEMSSEYRNLTAQCVVYEDIASPINYMLETLLLHVHAEYARSRDAESGILMLVSIIVRLAMRMGYHRDSASYPAITPFQGEMRRRIWTVVRQADLLFSSQVGLPPMVKSDDTNTDFPSNIWDDELSEDIKTLPPSRPLTELTTMAYMITKAHLVHLYGRVVEVVQPLKSSPYEEVMKLDQELEEWKATMPAQLQMRPLEESTRDLPNLIMQRYILHLQYLRAQIVLHRKFLNPCRQNSRYAYSRRTCIDAALMILEIQATLYKETQNGGRLRGVKWFISSLTNNDYLLSAMIVCLDLYHTSEAERASRRSSTDVVEWPLEKREHMMSALERTLSVWANLKEQSMEAYKAYNTLNVTLNKLKQQRALRAQQTFVAEDPNVAPEHSAAMTLGMLSGSLTPNQASMFDSPQYSGFSAPTQQSSGLTPNFSGSVDPGATASSPGVFGGFFGTNNMVFQPLDQSATGIDWDAWDSFMQAPSTMDPSNQVWPMGMDIPTQLDGQTDGPQQQPPQQPGQGNGVVNGANGGVFMGVSTPPRNAMM